MVRLAPWVLVGHHGWWGGVGLYPPMQNGPQKSPGGPVVGTHGGLWLPMAHGGLRCWSDATVGREEPTVGGVAPAHPTWASPKE